MQWQHVHSDCMSHPRSSVSPLLLDTAKRTSQPFRSTRGARRIQSTSVSCVAQARGCQDQQQMAAEGSSRRQALGWAAAAVIMPLLDYSPAEAVEKGGRRRGLSAYIKKKALDPLDTYVPPVLQARQQLLTTGDIMGKDAGSARSLLREGAFDGLRDNIRALGEFAEQNGAAQDGGGLVNGFFRALEAFDLRLFEAGRFDRPVAEGTGEILDGAVKALDRLLETVPADDMDRAKAVLRAIDEALVAPAADAAPSSPGSSQKLILPPTQ